MSVCQIQLKPLRSFAWYTLCNDEAGISQLSDLRQASTVLSHSDSEMFDHGKNVAKNISMIGLTEGVP
jgi:hypothetical protein